jgi:RNA-directed DNA polymerase
MKRLTIVEGRNLGNNNLKEETYMNPTEIKYDTNTKLERIAWLSKQNPQNEFANLMHLYNEESLTRCYHELDRNKALGNDKVSKEMYGQHLSNNIQTLLKRMKDMAYRPKPVRQVLIPKEGKAGATRPLGISNFEDKIIQSMTKKILESIYEPTFYSCSYGFRPGRGCHDAIKDLLDHLHKKEVAAVIDIDLGNFFGTINHQILLEFLDKRITDFRFKRYIVRMFKAGVLSEGELTMSPEGVPQGSICSPVLANIFAHHVIDEWICDIIKPYLKGEIRLFRYADDVICCCENTEDANRVREALTKRLTRFKLHLNEEKTKMVPFSKRDATKGIKQGTFDFLGFTFYLGKSRGGRVVPKLKTVRKRLRNKLSKVKEWIRVYRHKMKLVPLWKRFCMKLAGHCQYYGVSYNSTEVSLFFDEAIKLFYKVINRRSQRNSFCWEKYNYFCKRYPVPKPRIVHKLF